MDKTKHSAIGAGTRLTGGSLLLLAAVSSALAQNSSSTAPSVDGIEEIVVTARKREESLQEIPVAVSAISAAQIARQDLTSFEKIAAVTPQLTVGRAGNGSGAQISMRGIGTASTSIGIEQSVAAVVDGAYSGIGRVIYEGFFDLAGVEILRGPQALFFGKNATAGVISIKTADPGDTTEVKVRGAYEFKGQRMTGEGVFSTPLTDTLGLRIAVRALDTSGGYYNNIADPVPYNTFDVATSNVTPRTAEPAPKDSPGESEILARATLQWKPVDTGLTATLKFNYDKNKLNNNQWNYVAFGCATGFSTLNPAWRCKSNFDTAQVNLPASVAAATPNGKDDGSLYNDLKSWNTTLNLDWDLSKAALTSVFAYHHQNNSWACNCAFPGGPIFATEKSTWRAFSNETRLSSRFDGPLNGLIGVYYQKTKRVFDQNVVFAALENTAATPGNQFTAYSKNSETKGQTISVFAQVAYKFLERWELSGGARYIHETKDSYFVQPYVNPALFALFVPATFVRADQTFNNTSPEATLKFQASDNVNLYAAYKTAYKSGGLSNSGIYSGLSTTPDEDFLFAPEKAKGFEIGMKTVLADNQLRLNVTAYRYKFTNLQVDFFNAPTFAFLTINAGAAVSKGVETEFEFVPRGLPGLTMSGSLNYNKAKYEKFTGPCYAGQSIAQGCPSPTGPGGFPQQDLSGKPTAVAPEWTASLGGYYEQPVSDKFVLGIGANARYSGDYLANNLGNELSRVGSYVTVDAMVRLKTADDRWEVALAGKNLTNRQYFLGTQDAPATGSGTGTATAVSADQVGYGTMPRTVELSFTYYYK
jgi:iron complex outermembrane receptor protein